MPFLLPSIDSLSPVRLPIRAKLAVILASFWTADSDRVVAAFDHLVIALLHPVSPVVPLVLAPLHPCGLRETEERADDRSRDG
jgi:hypothetical protein